MFGGLRKRLEELTAQVNPLDGGKTASTVRAARQAPPAQTVKVTGKAPSYGKGLAGVVNRGRDLLDANTPQDRFRRNIDEIQRFTDQTAEFNNQLAQGNLGQLPSAPKINQSYKDQQIGLGNKRPYQNVGAMLLGNTARLDNTFKAGAREVLDTAGMYAAQATGNTDAWNQINKSNQAFKQKAYQPDSGAFGQGTIFDKPEDFNQMGAGEITKRVLATTAGAGLEVLPAAKGAGISTNLLSKAPNALARGGMRAGAGFVEGATQDALEQQINRDHFSPGQAVLSGAFGGVLGAGAPAVGRVTTKLVSNRAPLDEAGSVRLPFSRGEGPDELLRVNNPDNARVGGLQVNNPDGAKTRPLPINNPTGADYVRPPLKVRNNTGAPLVGENLQGAARQSYEGARPTTSLIGKVKSKMTPLNEEGFIRVGKDEPNVPRKLTEEEYLAQNGAPFLGGSEPALNRQPRATEKQIKKAAENNIASVDANNAKRATLRQEYQAKLKRGELEAPSGEEKLIQTANGHPDNKATQAARRLLDKRGVNWKASSIEKSNEIGAVGRNVLEDGGAPQVGRAVDQPAPRPLGTTDNDLQRVFENNPNAPTQATSRPATSLVRTPEPQPQRMAQDTVAPQPTQIPVGTSQPNNTLKALGREPTYKERVAIDKYLDTGDRSVAAEAYKDEFRRAGQLYGGDKKAEAYVNKLLDAVDNQNKPTPIKVKGSMSDTDYKARFGKEREGKKVKVKPFEAEDYAFEKWEDKNPLGLGRETLDRNIDRVAGVDAPRVKKFLVDASRKNETDRALFLNTLRQQTRKDVVDRLGIKPKSQESELVQQYGEGIIKSNELKELAGDRAPAIAEAADYFKKQYNDLLDVWNAERSKYGYDPVPKRKDYFRHFREIEAGGGLLGIIKNARDLPTNISGITDIFRPNKPFSTAEMKRLSNETTFDAVSGFDNYLDAVSRQIYHLDTVQRGRGIEGAIRKAAESNPEIQLPNFVANLSEWTNLVSGKKARIDRAAEQLVGRKVYTVAQVLRARTGANMVGANLSSAVTNYIPFTQSLATTSKPSAAKGIMSALFTPFQKNPDVIDGVRSGFLTRRFVKDSIKETGVRRAAELSSKPFEFVDQFTSRSIVAGKYYENIAKGMEPKQAMKAADDYASKVITDRSIGQLPNLMETRTAGFLTQFQAEVNNQVSFLTRDIPQFANGNPAKIASSLTQFVLYAYMFNAAYEQIMGRRPQIDPIKAAMDIYSAATEENEKTPVENAIKATPEALKENIAQGLPFSSLFTGGRLPVNAMFPDINAIGKGLSNIGTDKPVLPQLYKGVSGPLYYGVPPFGGGQIKKSAEGLYAAAKGESVSPSGKQRFTVDQNPLNVAKAATFGQYATDEGKQYIKGLRDNLSGRSGKLKKESSGTTKIDGKDVDINSLPLSQRLDRYLTDDKKEIDSDGIRKTVDEMAPKIKELQIDGIGDIPVNTRTAKIWSQYQQRLESGNISKVEQANEKRKVQRELYRTTVSQEARDLSTLPDGDIRNGIEQGLVTKRGLEEAIDLDNKLVKAGLLSSPNIGNTLRAELGVGKVYAKGKEPKGKSGRKGGGRGGKRAPKYDWTKPLFQTGTGSGDISNNLRKILESATLKSSKKKK